MRLHTVYGQRDGRWASERLGLPGVGAASTLGGYGCYVTCFAMLATYYGQPLTPSDVNAHLAAQGRFVQGNLVADDALEAIVPAVEHVASLDYRHTPADLQKLQQLLADPATSVVLEVDFNAQPRDGVQTHFVVAVGCDGHRVTIADPWYGTLADLAAHYGDPRQAIHKMVVYRGPVTQEVAQEVTKEDEMTPDQRLILDKISALGANAESIDSWIGKIGRAAEIGRLLEATKRMPRIIRPLLQELARIAS